MYVIILTIQLSMLVIWILKVLLLGWSIETLFVNVRETKIWESKQQILLGVLIARDLKFDEYVLS